MTHRTITTICFDGQFWIAVIERFNGANAEIAKHVFGAEPSNAELLAWAGKGFDMLQFRAAPDHVVAEPPTNPKRRKRESAIARREEGVQSRARDALKMAAELQAQKRKAARSESRREQARRRFADRIARKKARRRSGS